MLRCVKHLPCTKGDTCIEFLHLSEPFFVDADFINTHTCKCTHPRTFRGCLLPDYVHCSRADLGVAAHDWHAGSKRAINAEDHALHAPWQHSQVSLRTSLISPWVGKKREKLHLLQNSCKPVQGCLLYNTLQLESSHTDTPHGYRTYIIQSVSLFSMSCYVLLDNAALCKGHATWILTWPPF